MNRKLAFSMALGLCSLAACSREAPPSSASAPAPGADNRELERALQAPLDKARAVEADMKKARRDQDALLEEGGG